MADGGRSNADIAKRLNALIEALDLKPVSFAALVNVSQPAISNYLSGLRRPDLDVGIAIQVKTGATLDWLYLGDRSGLPARLLGSLPDLSAPAEKAI